MTWSLERDHVIQVRRLSDRSLKVRKGIVVFNTFIYFKPVKIFRLRIGVV